MSESGSKWRRTRRACLPAVPHKGLSVSETASKTASNKVDGERPRQDSNLRHRLRKPIRIVQSVSARSRSPEHRLPKAMPPLRRNHRITRGTS